MFFIRSGSGLDSTLSLLPGVIAISILFGTTSMLAVMVTLEKWEQQSVDDATVKSPVTVGLA